MLSRDKGNIRTSLGEHRSYGQFCREERNLAAAFYHCLLLGDNLDRFLRHVRCPFAIEKGEDSIHLEYAYLRDAWHALGRDNGKKRHIILEHLDLNGTELARVSPRDFNAYFGVVKPSQHDIQMPSTWSLRHYCNRFRSEEELLKVSQFKWVFRIKPDIVVHTSQNTCVCIETKLTSEQGSYPQRKEEKRIWTERGLKSVSQSEMQRHLMEQILGFETHFVWLTKTGTAAPSGYTPTSWRSAFSAMDMNGVPGFLLEMVSSVT